MLSAMLKTLEGKTTSIVFPEGNEPRVLNAAVRLHNDGYVTPVLLGNVEEVKAVAASIGVSVEGIEIIDPATYAEMDEAACRAALAKTNYFGTMLVAMKKADGLVGGATYSTADTVRPALQLVKTKPGSKIVSSAFILVRGDEKLAMGDCAINIMPTEDNIVEIALETANTAKVFGM